MKISITTVYMVVLLFASVTEGYAEAPALHRIALLTNTESSQFFRQMVRDEVEALFKGRNPVEFEHLEIQPTNKEEAERLIAELMNREDLNCIIGLDLGISELLAHLDNYPKPVIAAAILDANLQGLRMTPEGTSGITNFNYIESPFDVKKDLATLRSLYDFQHLGILHNSNETYMFSSLLAYLGKTVQEVSPDAAFTIVEIDEKDLEGSLEELPPGVDAVYMPLVFTEKGDAVQKALITHINKRCLPSFALQGETVVRLGAMASIAPDRNIASLSRRIAINVLNILSGMDAGDQKVRISTYTDNLVINVGTLREIGYYPSWEALARAHLINLEGSKPGREINLRGTILEALETNLELRIEKYNTSLKEQDIGTARSPLLPQATLSSSFAVLDENRANGELGSPAPYTWYAGGRLSQSIFSDDLLANFQIQKILYEAQQFQEEAQLLDTVVTAAHAYINLLFSKSNHTIINNNLSVTRKNLDIAKSKAAVGSVGASDVHRWENEVAQNQISLNDAYRDVQHSKMLLNQILNRPIDEPYVTEDIQPLKSIELMITDPAIFGYLEDFEKLSRFGEFLVAEAERNLPELYQAEAVVRSNERAVLNSERSFYLPDVMLTGEIDKTIDEYDNMYDTSSDLDHPWSVAVTASWPLFNGQQRKYDLARNRFEVRKSKLQVSNLRNKLQLQVRSNLETAAVSTRGIELSKKAAVAAKKNLEIIQSGYSEGRNSIADLIDAQNANIKAEQGEAIARYQFVLDFLELERSIGRFHFLATQTDREEFLARLADHMDSPPKNVKFTFE